MVTEEQINDAYDQLGKFKELLWICSSDLADDKKGLEDTIAKALMDGTIEGKNQQLRDAAAKEKFSELFEKVDESQCLYDQTRLNCELANNEVERLRLVVRLIEVTKN